MAECFCGCGRKVRFEKKRMSQFGADTSRRIDNLRRALPDLEDAASKQYAEGLIEAGEKVRSAWQKLIHDEIPAPTVTDGMTFRKSFHEWEAMADAALADARK